MFRRKTGDADDLRSDTPSSIQSFETGKVRNLPQSLPGRGSTVLFHPDVPNRPSSSYTPPSAPVQELPGREPGDSKRLIVGREITLAGEILDCERLVVEGTVRAKLSAARLLEIAKGGQFHGSVNVDNAEIAGTFEGELTVRNRLHIHASGRIFGKTRYGQLEVERGGRVNGDVGHEAEHHEGELRAVELATSEGRSA